MKVECDLCKNKVEYKDYNTLTLEGINYNIKKILCVDCAKKISKFIAGKDKREISHTITQVLNTTATSQSDKEVVFKLTIKVDNEIYFVKTFDSYTEANNFILPLIKLKNRYSKQVMLDKLNSMR